jgi:acyl-CoA synthetase (AMP-forming)/AMP-acid ligase II
MVNQASWQRKGRPCTGLPRQPDAQTRAAHRGWWFRTGDLGEFVDEAGNVRISGRKKEIINRGGKKYFPREIEEILYEHPGFLHVAVVGLPDPRLGERNCLCAVLKPGASVTLDDVVTLLKGAWPTTSCLNSSNSCPTCR